jgi:hypothetical protein
MVLGFIIWKEKLLDKWFENQRRIFVGHQIRALLQYWKFEDLLSQIEKSAWKSFKSVVKIFSGNRKSPKYRKIVVNCYSYTKLGVQYGPQYTFLALPPAFLPWQSWCRQWRTRGTFPRHFCLLKEVPGTEECKNIFRLLLDDEERCSIYQDGRKSTNFTF